MTISLFVSPCSKNFKRKVLFFILFKISVVCLVNVLQFWRNCDMCVETMPCMWNKLKCRNFCSGLCIPHFYALHNLDKSGSIFITGKGLFYVLHIHIFLLAYIWLTDADNTKVAVALYFVTRVTLGRFLGSCLIVYYLL